MLPRRRSLACLLILPVLAAACKPTPTPQPATALPPPTKVTPTPTSPAPVTPGSPAGDIIFLMTGDLWTLRPSATEPQRLTEVGWVSQPQPSPDGAQVAYLSVPKDKRPTEPWVGQLPHELWLLSLADGNVKQVSTAGAEPSEAAWDWSTGDLIWGEADRLMRLTPGGAPEVLASGLKPLLIGGAKGSVHPAVSLHGQGILWNECGASSCQLRLRTADGQIKTVDESKGIEPYRYVWVETPNGERVAWSAIQTGHNSGTWSLYDPATGTKATQTGTLGLFEAAGNAISFAPDGRLRVVSTVDPGAKVILISPPPQSAPGGFNDVTWVAVGNRPATEVIYGVTEPAETVGLYRAPLPASEAVRIVTFAAPTPLTDGPNGWPRALRVPRAFTLLPPQLAP